MMRAIARQPFTIVFAVLAGLVVSPLVVMGMQGLTALYDAAFPVVEMRSELVRADKDEVIIRISGVKKRACTYLRVQAAIRDADGTLADASIRRSDSAENGDTKAPGRYYLGEWRVWPRSNAVAVLVDVNHLCGDRVVVTRIAEVNL